MDAFVKRMPPGESVSVEARATRSGPSDEARRAKRRKRRRDSGSDTSAEHGAEPQDHVEEEQRRRTTDVENALAPTQVDDDAIKEYEDEETRANETEAGAWMPGKRSIYVDAFNLALDTVLEDEWHLFDEEERQVFDQWRRLDYQSQYLYVRLFLRKTDAWHRSSRLKYQADIGDAEAAVERLKHQHAITPCKSRQASDELAEMGFHDAPIGESFSFVNVLHVDAQTISQALPLLLVSELTALAKEAKTWARGKNGLVRALVATSRQQKALGLGTRRGEEQEQEQHVVQRTRGLVGTCVRVSRASLALFERVHVVFYKSTAWSEKSLTTVILARMAKRSYADYVVCRTRTIFASRLHLVEFEEAIRLEARVDHMLEAGDQQQVLAVLDRVYARWERLVARHRDDAALDDDAYLRRFSPAHAYTRIMHKALGVFARRKLHQRQHALLGQLLAQRLFLVARRGAWYQRKALVEQHYLADSDPLQLVHWRRAAAATCEAGLQDPDCHVVYHYDLQKRLVRLEKLLRLPRRLQHDFAHVRLAAPVQMSVSGIQLLRRAAASSRTVWLGEAPDTECSVEEMCLSRFRRLGWTGYHAEAGILRTLFAYLFYDALFCPVPNVFQSPYQSCPLDLFTDAFYPSRASLINALLARIANGAAPALVSAVWARHHARRTAIVGLNWDFPLAHLLQLAACLGGHGLATLCKLFAQDYRLRVAGVPDLLLWRLDRHAVLFVEVKSVNDGLADSQRLWIHVLTAAGIPVALCNAVATEVRHVD
ncbi:hypothetical protein CDD82_4813 [Ophiocordyceps australis]|uniref:Fanconi-associated nuclease n=1 Tax=Ophiocordyceps australis TaxID=1399860 RepID=A0A2C5Z4B2_9HYPO|nr:hypothetical protein CDD82_4813 [Ophiocordyceps australis]